MVPAIAFFMIFINFLDGENFLDFYITALIVGRILEMNRKLLVKAVISYLPIIVGGVIVALLLTGVIGKFLSFGFKEAGYFIAIPTMGGGMGAGEIPLSTIFGGVQGKDPKVFLSMMVSAVALGNTVSIVAAGLLNKLGEKMSGLSGKDRLLKAQDDAMSQIKVLSAPQYQELGMWLCIAT